jgi:hypothetical protein
MTPVPDVIGDETERVRAEFLDMPALRLTAPQAARLLSLGVDGSAAALSTLEDEGFLIRAAGGVYRRASPPMA